MEAIMMVCNLVPKKFGGFERFLVELGRACRERRVRLGLMLAGEPIVAVAEAFRDQGIHWRTVTEWRAPSGRERRSVFVREFGRFNALGPWDVAAFHFCSEPAVAAAVALSRLSGGRRFAAVWHQHSQIARATGMKKIASRIRMLTPFMDSFVALTEIGARSFIERACKPEKVKVIHNGCEIPEMRGRGRLRPQLGLPDSSTLMITVAGLLPLKGLDVLLEAVAPLLSGPGDRHLLIVGDGPMRKDLDQQAKALSIGNRVHFLGLRDDVTRILADCDLFVLASRSESFSLAAIEAMAVGLPTVATNVGGVPEVVADGVTGLLVRPDDAMGLREAISTLLRVEGLARTFGENGRERCSRLFSIERMVENHLSLYSELSQ